MICDWQTLASGVVKDTGTLLDVLLGARRHWGVLVAVCLGRSSDNTAAAAAAQAVLRTYGSRHIPGFSLPQSQMRNADFVFQRYET